jgi:hypothetical protein
MNEHDLADEVRAEQRTILAAIWLERVIRWTPALVLAAALAALLMWGAR